jgi:uncharacterized membrane protein YedE/YeeE
MLLSEWHALIIFNLVAGMIIGSVLYRSDFCFAAVFRDLFLLKDFTLLRPFILLVVLTTILFFLVRLSGVVLIPSPPFLSYPSAATFIGGAVFGIGMVLAGGCVVSTLYRMASGNIASLIGFIGIIVGSMVYAELHPLWDSFRRETRFLEYKQLSEITPRGDLIGAVLAVIVFIGVFAVWTRQGKWNVVAYANGYLQPWKTAVIIAFVNTGLYVFSGWPLSIATVYAKLGAYIEQMLIPSHAAGVRYFHQDSVSLVLSGTAITGGGGPRIDIFFLTQIPLLVGIIAGAFFTAIVLKEFRVMGFPPVRQTVSAITGGILLGFGARIAGGCNVTFVLGAVPLFFFQGILFMVAMILGAYVGVRILKSFVII